LNALDVRSVRHATLIREGAIAVIADKDCKGGEISWVREQGTPECIAAEERLIANMAQLIDQSTDAALTLADFVERAESELRPAPLSLLVRALAGGTCRKLQEFMFDGSADALAVLTPQLAHWVRGYRPLPIDPAPAPAQARTDSKEFFGGRAPGTLTLAPNDYQSPTRGKPPGLVRHSCCEQILDAVAQLSTTHGYTQLNAGSIADHAGVSERTFLAHFKSKDDAFASAVEVGHVKAQAIVARSRSGAEDWRGGVCHAIHALLEFLASEPYFTHLAFISAPLTGPAMARRAHEHAGAYARLLLDGAPQHKRPPQIASEAIVHGLFELVFYHATSDKLEELPRAAREARYLALAPFVTVEEAATATASSRIS
jgi:AcrR family transcriptional regulator